jgi:hypothetical protein
LDECFLRGFAFLNAPRRLSRGCWCGGLGRRAPSHCARGDVTRCCSKTSGSSTDEGGAVARDCPDTLKHLTRHAKLCRPSAGSFQGPESAYRPVAASGQKEEAAQWRPLQRHAVVRMSSRPPFTPEPQKRDRQILVANCIAGEAVVRIVSSNSFDRCNYATSASDRRVHGVFYWCPRSNSRIVNSPRPGRVASPPTPLPPCPAVQG